MHVFIYFHIDLGRVHQSSGVMTHISRSAFWSVFVECLSVSFILQALFSKLITVRIGFMAHKRVLILLMGNLKQICFNDITGNDVRGK